MRRPEPWYWMQRDGWYVQIAGKQKKLASGKANKAAAYEAFHALMAGEGMASPAQGPDAFGTRGPLP